MIEIRVADPAEADTLTAIADAAKRSWGYPAEWITVWREALTLTRADWARGTVRVAVLPDGERVGFYALVPGTARWTVEHFWVAPAHMGQGIGWALLADALAVAQAAGALGLEIDSDPHAQGFYRRHGGERIGAIPAPMAGAPARVLPRFWLDTLVDR